MIGKGRFKRVLLVVGTIIGIVAVFLVVLNMLFFSQTVSLLSQRALSRCIHSDFSISGASGNLFSGLVELKGVRVNAQVSPNSRFRLEAERMNIDMDVSSILILEKNFETFHVSNSKGFWTGPLDSGSLSIGNRFDCISDLIITRSILEIRRPAKDREKGAITVKIDRWSCPDMRRGQLLFDVLLNSNITGEMMGRPFSIEREREKEKNTNTVRWKFADINLKFLVPDTVPGNLKKGSVDIEVIVGWVNQQDPLITMEWKLKLPDIEMPLCFNIKIRKSEFNVRQLKRKIARALLYTLIRKYPGSRKVARDREKTFPTTPPQGSLLF